MNVYWKDMSIMVRFFMGIILIILFFMLILPLFAQTVNEYDRYGTKTGYYVTNGTVTTYYNKYGSKVYEYKNGKKYDKYGKVVKQYR